MSKEPNNIDRLVREKLDGFEMTPPPGVWENTAASLNGGRKKRFFLWFALSFILLVAPGTGIYFFSTQNDDTEQLALNDSLVQNEKLNEGDSNKEDRSNSTKNIPPSTPNNESGNLDKSDSNVGTDHSNDATRSFEGSNKMNQTDNGGSHDSAGSDRSSNSRGASNRSGSDASNHGAGTDVSGKQGSDQTGSDGQSTSNGGGKQASSTQQGGNKQNSGGNGQAPNISGGNGSNQNGGGLANNATSDGSGEHNGPNDSGNEKTGSQTSSDGGKQNDISNSSESGDKETFGSLPTRPAQELASEEPSIANDKPEAKPLIVPTPFWKAFSLEGAIGMSTFRNIPNSTTTPPNLLSALNAAASGRRSTDFRFGVNYHFTNRFSLQSGVHFSSSKENYTFDSEQINTFTIIDTVSFTVDTTFDTTWVIDTNIFDSTITLSNTIQNSYRILTLPFQFAWSQPISERGRLELALGGAISIFGRNTGTIINGDSTALIGADAGYKTTGLLSLGGSIKYLHRFGNHSVYIEPWAQFGISNQSLPALTYESLRRRYGIRIGYRYYF